MSPSAQVTENSFLVDFDHKLSVPPKSVEVSLEKTQPPLSSANKEEEIKQKSIFCDVAETVSKGMSQVLGSYIK